MSELTARLAVYGSIDRTVVGGEELSPEDAAVHLPTYLPSTPGAASAAGWYEALSEVISGSTDGAGLDPPDHADAIGELAELPLQHPIDAEHRLRALFLAGRLLRDLDTSPGSAFVGAVQRVVEFRGGPDGQVEDAAGTAQQLSQMLVGESDQLPRDASYAAVAEAAGQSGSVSALTAALAAATCDEGTTWYDVPGDTTVDVAAVVTSRVTVFVAECSVNDLRLRFHPGRWPACLPTFWGAMDPFPPPYPNGPSPTVDPGTSMFVYREHVGDQSNNSQWFEPVLEFWYDEYAVGPTTARVVDGFALRYGMARNLPPGQIQDPAILVDDGEMVIRRSNVANGSMTVTARTSKILAMRPPLPSAGLSIFACAAGWADHAKALVTGCLLNP